MLLLLVKNHHLAECHYYRQFVTGMLSSQDITHYNTTTLECGPMPNVMVALPNIGGALCSTLQSLARAHYLTAVQ